MILIEKINSILLTCEDDTDAVEKIMELILENSQLDSSEVLEWFKSPFVSEYDKKYILNEYAKYNS